LKLKFFWNDYDGGFEN